MLPDDLACGLIVFVDVRGHGIDVQNGRFARRVDALGRVFHDVIAHADEQICIFQHAVGIVLLRNADRPKGIGAGVGNHALGHHRVDDGDVQRFGHLRSGLRLRFREPRRYQRESPDFDCGRSCPPQFRCVPATPVSRVRACTVERDFALRHILQGYVHGQIDVRCAGFALALGVFECQPCDFRDGIGPHDKLGALGHRLEHLGQIEKLVRRQVNFVGGNLPGDGDQPARRRNWRLPRR